MATKKAVGKRTRGTGRTKEELELFYSLIPEQHGRSICFRAAQCSTRSIDFYCIPVDDDDIGAADVQLPPELLYGKRPKLIWALLSTTNISRSSTFEAVGKSMYCVGGHVKNGKGEETSRIYHFDTTGDNCGAWFRNSFDMCCPRVGPSTIVMEGKLFIIGGQVVSDSAPLVEVFDPSSESSLIVESPPESLHESMIFVTAALPDKNQILVACTYEKVAYLLDVNTGAWVPIDVDFGAVEGKAAVVLKTIMCWYDDSRYVLMAYDLNLKTWFKTPVKGLKRVCRRVKHGCRAYFSLFPLDENHLCLLWADHVNPFLLHCTKVSVSLSDNRFCAAVASSRSYLLRENSFFLDGLLLDLTSTPEE